MQRVAPEAHRRLAGHVPAGRGGEHGAQHALVRDRDHASCAGVSRSLRSQRTTRSRTSRGLSPPGGRKSKPARFVPRERLAVTLAAIRRGRKPSHSPQSISISAGSRCGGAPDSISAVSTARRSGLDIPWRCDGGRGDAGRLDRHASTSARPRALKGMSRRPCMRPSSFHAVLPWRRNATIIAQLAAEAWSARGRRVLRARRDAAPHRGAPPPREGRARDFA